MVERIHLPYQDYGGIYYWDREKDYFSFERHYGFGSNFCFLMTVLAILKNRNIYPKKMSAYLTNYKNYNLFDKIFYINLNKLEEWTTISNKDFDNLYFNTKNSTLHQYGFGFGDKSSDVNFKILKPLLDTYFCLTPIIMRHAENLMKEINFNPESIFVWWRKTDKTTEVLNGYPELKVIKKYLSTDRLIYFQSDDKEIINEVLSYTEFKNIRILNVLPPCNENVGAHEIIYREGTSHEAEKHILNLVALIIIASKCSHFIGYPGSISNVICMFKKSFKNTVIFKPFNELYTDSEYQIL